MSIIQWFKDIWAAIFGSKKKELPSAPKVEEPSVPPILGGNTSPVVAKPAPTTPVVKIPPTPMPEVKVPEVVVPYILRVTSTGKKNKYGLIELRLGLCREYDLSEVDSVIVTSGQAGYQTLREAANSRGGSHEPCPEGYYDLGVIEWAGGKNNWTGKVWSGGLGPLWIAINPAKGMKTSRSALGFHVDWNEDVAMGSDGCLVFKRDLVEAKRFLSWFENPRTAPKKLTVNYGFGSVETKTLPPASHPGHGTSNPSKKPAAEFIQSPNFSARNGSPIKRVVYHYTTSANIAGTISWFQNPASQVSAHYVIGKDGRLVQMVKDADKAWHCYGNNADTIGIELVAVHGDKLTLEQELSLIALSRWLLGEYHLTTKDVTAHRFTKENIGQTDCPGTLWKTEAELSAWVQKQLT